MTNLHRVITYQLSQRAQSNHMLICTESFSLQKLILILTQVFYRYSKLRHKTWHWKLPRGITKNPKPPLQGHCLGAEPLWPAPTAGKERYVVLKAGNLPKLFDIWLFTLSRFVASSTFVVGSVLIVRVIEKLASFPSLSHDFSWCHLRPRQRSLGGYHLYSPSTICANPIWRTIQKQKSRGCRGRVTRQSEDIQVLCFHQYVTNKRDKLVDLAPTNHNIC